MRPEKSSVLLPGMHHIQGVGSSTFCPIPVNHDCSLPEVIDYQFEHSSRHPAMIWRDDNDIDQKITWSEFGRAIHRVARAIADKLGYDLDKHQQPSKTTYVAIMATGDQQSYNALILGIVRAGCVAFPLSNNNSVAATVHLLKAKNCELLIGNGRGTAPTLEQTVKDSLREAPFCSFVEWIPYEVLYAADKADNFKHLPSPPILADLLLPAITFHSSGSTSFPKPIVFSHLAFRRCLSVWNYSRWDFTDRAVFLGHLPPFHALCALVGLSGLIGASSTIATFPPRFPPRPSNPNSTIEASSRIASWIIVSPIFVEIWSRDEESIQLLKKFDRVCFGGGPLNRKVGQNLVDKGVKLHTSYGATEIGHGLCFDIYEDPNMWEWNLNIPTIQTFFRPMKDVEKYGEYELLVGATDRYSPNVFNDDYNGVPVFATNDLVELHPQNPQIYRIVGRKDDQIMLSSGEKTNPGPLQPLIEKSNHVKSCLYFGRERAHNGVLIEPIEAVNVENDEEVARFRNLIWMDVEEANMFAPSHSRVEKEMILIGTSSIKPFERTAKGSLRSGIILKSYEKEIEAIYEAFKNSSQMADSIEMPKNWDIPNTNTFLQSLISAILDHRNSIKLNQNFFTELGADSLSATRIRNSISASLEKSKNAGLKVKTIRLPTDTVYQNPTIESLAKALIRLVEVGDQNGNHDEKGRDALERVKSMNDMVTKYSQNWPPLAGRKQKKKTSNGVVALITGSTGGLGSHTLEKLIRSDKVTTIWALNRGQNGKSPLNRHREAFMERGLNVDLLLNSKVNLVEADLMDGMLGLSKSTYEEIASSTTVIYHIAWRLDFNLSLASFEEHILASRNLIDVALHSSASFFFSSSIAVTAGTDTPHPVKEEDLPFSTSVGLGYGEGKAVTERLLKLVSEDRGLETCSIRIGQLSGSTTNGYWATTDWVPIMIKSSIALGKIPSSDSAILTWLPTDVCAAALLEIKAKGNSTRHILHTRPVLWKDVISVIANDQDLELVSFQGWVDTLEKVQAGTSGDDVNRIPAIKLLKFFKHQFSASSQSSSTSSATATSPLDCTHSLEESQSLRTAPQLSQTDAKQWMSYWKGKRYIK